MIYVNASLSIDYDRHEVLNGTGEPIELTPTQWRMVTLFIKHQGHALPNRFMRQCCLANEKVVSSTIKWHISVLRNKLGDAFAVKTIRGYGYRYDG